MLRPEPRKIARGVGRAAKRVIITVVGVMVVVAGLAMLVLPGPGWLAIFLGLAILGSEYDWAKRLLEALKKRFGDLKDGAKKRLQARNEPDQ